jgi:hypothetical protein
MRRRLSAILLLAAVEWSSTAFAQSNDAAAEALFMEGRSLVESGRVEEGCKKLEASQALDPGTGTLIHLGDCYEKLGRTATAWARFREAASRAARDGRTDWETIAKARAIELEPKLARLRVDAPAGVTVRRDAQDVPAAALGSLLPVDPGDYTIAASAPGKKPWSAQVHVTPSATSTIVVPPLEDDPASPPPPSDGSAPHPTDSSSLRTIGYATGAVGIVGIVVGAVSGLMAISLNDRAKKVCPNDGVCADEGARNDSDRARTAATVSTIGFVAGGALLAGGVALILTAPRAPAAARVRATPGAVFFEGAF